MAMAGFLLDHTLSANGTVTRGVCITEGEQLTRVVETYGIKEEDGVIVCDDPEVAKWIHHGERVSMNMWRLRQRSLISWKPALQNFWKS